MGNDVVDLKEPGNVGKSKDERYLCRVLDTDERKFLVSSSFPDALLWSFWAAKEAAYKAVSRSYPAVCSIPHQYRVTLDATDAMSDVAFLPGRVATPHGELFIEVSVTHDWVHALAAGSEETLKRLFRRVDRLNEAAELSDPSEFVRRALLKKIALHLDCPVDALSVVKNSDRPGAPVVLFRTEPLSTDFSLSHDGRFAAFALDPATLITANSSR